MRKSEWIGAIIIICILSFVYYIEYKGDINCKEKGGTWIGGNIQKCIEVKEMK